MTKRERSQWDEWVKNRAAVPASNMESNPRHASVGKESPPRLAAPCRIHCRSFRHRLADSDGISAKAVIDGLVLGGVLQDDSPEYVTEVSYSQVKVPKAESERTEIIITPEYLALADEANVGSTAVQEES